MTKRAHRRFDDTLVFYTLFVSRFDRLIITSLSLFNVDYRKEFERMMETQSEIALATSVDGQPSVRIINFYYDPDKKTLFFSSFADNQKVTEVEQNPNVSFTTVPQNGEEHVRVRRGIARKSGITVEEMKDYFLAKMPEYLMSIPELPPELVLFEITFENADVVIDFEHMETIGF